jgi:hypothetical protein
MFSFIVYQMIVCLGETNEFFENQVHNQLHMFFFKSF